MGNLKDFATGIVATAPTPATSGTTIVLETGDGDLMPAVPFSAVVHPPAEIPTLDTAEKVTVTARTDDTLTVTRAQGDTTAKTIEAGWRFTNSVFLSDFNDKADASVLASHTSDTANPHSVTKAQVGLGSVPNIDFTSDIAANTAKVSYPGASASESLTNKNLNSGTNTFPTFNQNTTGSAATLTTSRTVRTNLASTSTASFNGSANITPGVTGTLPVSNGGTGAATHASGNYLKGAGTGAVTSETAATLAATVGALLFPVGSYYMNETVSTNPATLLGFGTWVPVENRAIFGKGSGTFATAGATGGAETHTLTIAEMPAHDHGDITSNSVSHPFAGAGSNSAVNTNGATRAAPRAPSQGGGAAHNNMPPYIVAYIWKRTV